MDRPLTGAASTWIVDRGQGTHTATLYGRNLHVTGDGLAKLRKTIGMPVISGVGSTAVRDALATYQPMLSLHGHIHESRGEARIGRTLAINPGSEYSEGVLRGAIITLNRKKGVRGYQLVAG